jgi:biopolymer transport protein ExbB/TolQ
MKWARNIIDLIITIVIVIAIVQFARCLREKETLKRELIYYNQLKQSVDELKRLNNDRLERIKDFERKIKDLENEKTKIKYKIIDYRNKSDDELYLIITGKRECE